MIADAVSETSNPGVFPKAGRIFQQRFFLPENAQTLAGMASRAGKNFPAASRFARKPFQQGISDSHSLLEFSEVISSKTKGPGEEGAAGYCPKILLPPKKKPKWCSALSIRVIGKSALEIGHFLRRNLLGVPQNPGTSKPRFGEPVLCTPDSHGFRHFGDVALSPLFCGCLTCLLRFRDSRPSHESHQVAKDRLGKA